MVSYAPYFISTVVICGMIAIFMDKNTGIFNQIIVALGGEAQDFLSKPQYFKSIYVWSGVWPVSYTHLDVYKRQPWRGLTGS